jgi:hypothetical protein
MALRQNHSRFSWVQLHGDVVWCSRCNATAPLGKVSDPPHVSETTAKLSWFAVAKKHQHCQAGDVLHLPPVVAQPEPTPAPIPEPQPSNREELDDDAGDTWTASTRISEADVECIRAAFDRSLELRGEDHDDGLHIDVMERLAKYLETTSVSYVTAEALAEVLPDFDPRPIAAEMIGEFEELADLQPIERGISFDWSLRVNKRNGDFVLGRASAVGPKERGTWRGEGEAPWWKICLSLPYILAVGMQSPRGRRLVHHELMHCAVKETRRAVKPSMRNHCVEEFVMTVRRFGLMGQLQEGFVREGLAHLPETNRPAVTAQPEQVDGRARAAGRD